MTASKVERLKTAVHLYMCMQDMKQRADDLKRQARGPQIIGPCRIKILNPVYEEKMKLYNTLHSIMSIDDTYAALQLAMLIRKQ